MPLLESLVTGIGAAVAKGVLKVWLKDDPLVLAASTTTTDLLKKKLTNVFDRRAAERELEKITDRSAKSFMQLIDKEESTLGLEIGGAIIYEKLADESDTYASLRIAQTYTRQLSENAKVWQSAEFLPQVDEFDNYLMIAEIGIESKLSEKLSLRVVLQDRFDNEPAPGRKRNDVKLISGVSYSF